MSTTFKWNRLDVGCGSVSNIRPDMWCHPDAEGEYVLAEDAINREAVLQAQIRTLEVQLKDATAPQWVSVDERLPEKRELPYQVIVCCVKEHGDDSMYAGKAVRRFQQDWVVRQWPQNFTHWMEAMQWPKEPA